jgi:hypothetical protein
MRPSELREILESEARAMVEELRAAGTPIVPGEIAGRVLERHQTAELVKNRIEVLWHHLETFISEGCGESKHVG